MVGYLINITYDNTLDFKICIYLCVFVCIFACVCACTRTDTTEKSMEIKGQAALSFYHEGSEIELKLPCLTECCLATQAILAS